MQIRKSAFTLLIVALFSLTTSAQDEPSSATADSLAKRDPMTFAQYLPPLSILIDSAIANATTVDMTDIQIERSEYEVSRTSKDWMNIVNVTGQYRLSDAGIAQVEDGIFFPASDGPTSGYVLGVGVRVPISYFTERRDRMQMARLNVDMTHAQQEAAKREVKEQVIETYNQLLLLQRLIGISTEAKEFSELIFQMSEERFRDGELSLEEMGASTSLKAKFSSEYEQLRTEFSNTYALLERLVGVPLSKLQN